ncbi:hypothetical protein CYY_003423 [Polysphondylium violaceum]|uniref:Uncharacterized protein n=1 Tax=Polysphondylium violaceum TaxID=133409 RepID=A0A8J4PZR8_9MYCE|nr:hypothetical protein CYY_003423 [Polysphondylium violaceum]
MEQGPNAPVALNGTAIPKGMEEHADWMNRPIVEDAPKEDFGEEYNSVEKLREELGNLKKVVTSISPPIEAVYRLQQVVAPENEKEALEKQLAEQESKIDQIVIQLQSFITLLEKHPEYVAYKEGVEQVIKQSKTKFNSREEHFEFGNLCKKVTQNIFKDQKVLLEKMKAIKKAKQQQ